jgi:hypothetical protein
MKWKRKSKKLFTTALADAPLPVIVRHFPNRFLRQLGFPLARQFLPCRLAPALCVEIGRALEFDDLRRSTKEQAVKKAAGRISHSTGGRKELLEVNTARGAHNNKIPL